MKVDSEFIVINTSNDKKIYLEELNDSEKLIYHNFMNLTNNSDQFQIDDAEIDIFIHRFCNKSVTHEKYIKHNLSSDSEKIIINEFINLIKNKVQ